MKNIPSTVTANRTAVASACDTKLTLSVAAHARPALEDILPLCAVTKHAAPPFVVVSCQGSGPILSVQSPKGFEDKTLREGAVIDAAGDRVR